MTSIVLRVNGEAHAVTVRTGETLLRVLREKLGLTGTKNGCENGDCGAILAVEAEGWEIRTIEGLKNHPVQKAFVEHNGFQCGFCTSGQIMNAVALFETHPRLDEQRMRLWMESNLCRCTGYEGIRKALRSVVDSSVPQNR